MSIVAAAFRCIQPDLMTAYDAQRKTETEAFDAKVAEFRKTVNGRELHGIRFYDGGFSVQGYILESQSESPLPGWRYDGTSNRVVPAKRTPEGKAIAASLKDLVLGGLKFPGCPSVLHAENRIILPGVEKIDGYVILTLTFAIDSKESAMIDPTIWAPMKLSQYHAILEGGHS